MQSEYSDPRPADGAAQPCSLGILEWGGDLLLVLGRSFPHATRSSLRLSGVMNSWPHGGERSRHHQGYSNLGSHLRLPASN